MTYKVVIFKEHKEHVIRLLLKGHIIQVNRQTLKTINLVQQT